MLGLRSRNSWGGDARPSANDAKPRSPGPLLAVFSGRRFATSGAAQTLGAGTREKRPAPVNIPGRRGWPGGDGCRSPAGRFLGPAFAGLAKRSRRFAAKQRLYVCNLGVAIRKEGSAFGLASFSSGGYSLPAANVLRLPPPFLLASKNRWRLPRQEKRSGGARRVASSGPNRYSLGLVAGAAHLRLFLADVCVETTYDVSLELLSPGEIGSGRRLPPTADSCSRRPRP